MNNNLIVTPNILNSIFNKNTLKLLPLVLNAMDENLSIKINDIILNPVFSNYIISKQQLIETIRECSDKFYYNETKQIVRIKIKQELNILALDDFNLNIRVLNNNDIINIKEFNEKLNDFKILFLKNLLYLPHQELANSCLNNYISIKNSFFKIKIPRLINNLHGDYGMILSKLLKIEVARSCNDNKFVNIFNMYFDNEYFCVLANSLIDELINMNYFHNIIVNDNHSTFPALSSMLTSESLKAKILKKISNATLIKCNLKYQQDLIDYIVKNPSNFDIKKFINIYNDRSNNYINNLEYNYDPIIKHSTDYNKNYNKSIINAINENSIKNNQICNVTPIISPKKNLITDVPHIINSFIEDNNDEIKNHSNFNIDNNTNENNSPIKIETIEKQTNEIKIKELNPKDELHDKNEDKEKSSSQDLIDSNESNESNLSSVSNKDNLSTTNNNKIKYKYTLEDILLIYNNFIENNNIEFSEVFEPDIANKIKYDTLNTSPIVLQHLKINKNKNSSNSNNFTRSKNYIPYNDKTIPNSSNTKKHNINNKELDTVNKYVSNNFVANNFNENTYFNTKPKNYNKKSSYNKIVKKSTVQYNNKENYSEYDLEYPKKKQSYINNYKNYQKSLYEY